VRRFQVKAVGETLGILPEALETAQKMKGLNAGGSLSIMELGDGQFNPEALMDLTQQLITNQTVEFFTYNRIISFCETCRKSWFGTLHKCPSCGTMSALSTLDRFTSS
jgi:anaerobic ribonucleoside-triphosphate reductase